MEDMGRMAKLRTKTKSKLLMAPINFLRLTYSLIPIKFRVALIPLGLGLVVAMIFELIGLGLLIPFFSILLDPNPDSLLIKMTSRVGLYNDHIIALVLGLAIVMLFVIKNLYFRWNIKKLAKYAFDVYEVLSKQMYDKYAGMPLQKLKQLNTNMVIRDIDNVPKLFAQNIILPALQIIAETIVLMIIITLLFIYDWKIIVFVVLVIIPPFVLYYRSIKKRIEFLAKKRHKLTGSLRSELQEFLFGISEVRIYQREGFFRQRYESDIKHLSAVQVDFHYYKAIPPKIIETAMVAGIVLLFLTVSWVYSSPDEIKLTMTIFGLAAFRTLPSFNRILASFLGIRAGQFTIPLLDELINEAKEDVKVHSSKAINEFRHLEMKNVSHYYSLEENCVLNGVNFSIQKGEMVGLVGSSGSGKTTFINVLIGLLHPSEGEIKLNSEFYLKEDYPAFWKLLGYVKQEAFLVDGTIAENIKLGNGISSKEKDAMIEVLKLVHLDNFALQGAQGLERAVGEGGGQLSGGQRQRLCIARAIFSGAQFIVYDEATSAVDPETEGKINQTIIELKERGMTQLIISHKPSILEFCDRVYEIKNGVLVEKLKTT